MFAYKLQRNLQKECRKPPVSADFPPLIRAAEAFLTLVRRAKNLRHWCQKQDDMELRAIEAKIERTRYDVVNSYEKLMEIVV